MDTLGPNQVIQGLIVMEEYVQFKVWHSYQHIVNFNVVSLLSKCMYFENEFIQAAQNIWCH